MVEKALESWRLDRIDFLFIENVGNLVCPSSYDLGEELRFVLLSATEGEDKPLKYPTIFNSSDVAIITKMDLAEAAEFDLAAARRNIESVRPGMQIFEVSAKTGPGCKRCLTCSMLSLRVRAESQVARLRSHSRNRAGVPHSSLDDTVLIAAAFCMFNRHVDGLGTSQPRDEAMYRERGKRLARDGYVSVSKEYLPVTV